MLKLSNPPQGLFLLKPNVSELMHRVYFFPHNITLEGPKDIVVFGSSVPLDGPISLPGRLAAFCGNFFDTHGV